MPKSKRPKRKKDQDEPKRPLTAYNIFFRDERVRLLKEAAEEAKSKSEAEAAEMKELSEEGKLDASARSAATNGSGKKVRRRRRRNGRETHGLMSFEEMARKVSKKWHETSDEIKEKYQVLADEDRDRYDREKAAYLQKNKAKRDEDSSSQKAEGVSKRQAG